MNSAHEIAEADLNEAQTALEVRWADGHPSSYPLRQLRSECPCATCRSSKEEAKSNPFRVLKAGEGTPASYALTDVEPMGRYGLRLTWGDGHATGIYTFPYLREICPCAECKAARTHDDTPYVHGIYIPK